jgi:hypothetical protein
MAVCAPREAVAAVIEDHRRRGGSIVVAAIWQFLSASELNPAERLWEELREKEFANRVFDSLGAAIAQAARGLKRLERSPGFLQSLTGWDWILGSS